MPRSLVMPPAREEVESPGRSAIICTAQPELDSQYTQEDVTASDAQQRWAMNEPLGASGIHFPNPTVRRRLAAGLAALCLFVPQLAQGDGPAESRNSPAVVSGFGAEAGPLPVANRRLPPVDSCEGQHATFLSQAGLPDFGQHAGQAVKYIDAAPGNQPPGSPATTLNPMPGEPLFRFSKLQEPQPPPREDEQQGEGAAAPAAGSQPNDQQTYGQAPTNNALQFLRDIDVLLEPGAWQLDTGFVYTHFANDFPFVIPFDVDEGEVRQRLLFTPLAARYGFTENIQLFAALPIGWSNTQFVGAGQSETFNVGGLGDLTFGASIHLFDGDDMLPDVIGTIGATAPTGQFNAPVFGTVPGSALGQGFWAYNAQLLAIHRYDPVIVFYGGGYRHLFERSFDDVEVQPGDQANYMLGVGFSINDRVTLSTTFQGFYLTNTSIDNEAIRGSNLEPLTMRFAATIVRNCRIIEPFCVIGMTDSAPRANVGVVVTLY